MNLFNNNLYRGLSVLERFIIRLDPTLYSLENYLDIDKIKLFANRPEVKAAYVGWIYQPDADEPPHYIFGIDTEGAGKDAIEAAGDVAQQVMGPQEVMDFIKIGDDSLLSNYFIKDTQPFYTRPA